MLFKNLSSNLNNDKLDLNSDLGYTKSLNGPHEFGYFWKKWFPWKSWEEKKYNEINYTILQKELAAWESVNNTPLIFKNIIDVSFNIEQIAELFPGAFFIHIKREPEYVVQSTYQSRIKLFNDNKQWFGLEPPEYKETEQLEVFEQVCAQVYYSRKYIDQSISNNKIKSISINYETLINNTAHILDKIKNDLNLKSKNIDIPLLQDTNLIKLPEDEFNKIKFFCQKYFKE